MVTTITTTTVGMVTARGIPEGIPLAVTVLAKGPDTTMTDYSLSDDCSPDELFDRSDSVNLMGDHKEE